MADATAVLKLIVELAGAELSKVAKLGSGVRDLDSAISDLEKQDLKLDTEGLDRAQKELDETTRDVKELTKEGDRLEKEFTRAARALGKASKRIDFDPAAKSTQRLRAEVDRAGRAMLEFGKRAPRALNATEKELKDVERATRRARTEFKKFSQDASPSKFSKLTSTFQGLRTAVTGFFAAIVVRKVAELGGAAVRAANDLKRLENALDAIDGVGADEVLERVRARAKALGADLQGLEESTAKFINTALRMGLTLKESEAIVEGFSVAATGAGRTQEELNRALRQVEQGLAKNKFEMQDLKIIMEVLPGVTEALARGLGITTERLFELQKKGLIPAKEATIVLAAELPKLFGPAVLKNAADFRSTLQRVQNGIFETGREIGENMIPELEEWLKLFDQLEISGKSVAGSVSGAFKIISDQLQDLTRALVGFVTGDWIKLWDLAANTFDRFLIGYIKGSETLFAAISKVTGLSIKVLEDADGAVEKILQRIEDRQKRGLEDQLAAEEAAAAERKALLRKEQAEREDLANAAQKRFLDNLKDSNKEQLKELGDFAAKRRALLAESERGAGAEIGVSATGVEGVRDQLSDVRDLVNRIQEDAAGGLGLSDPVQDDINAIFGANQALAETDAVSRQAAAGLAVVEDVTGQVGQELDELANKIIKGGSEFDNLSATARNNVGLIVTELERLRERGGVQAFELADLLGELDKAFEKTGETGQTSAGKILDYNRTLDETASKASNTSEALDDASASIESFETDKGVKSFTNLGTGAEEAAEGVAALDGEIDDGIDLIFSWTTASDKAADSADSLSDSTRKTSKSIKIIETADGVKKLTNLGEGAKKAAEGVGALAKESNKTAAGVGKIATKAPEAGEGIKELGTAVAEAVPGLAEAGTAIGAVAEPIGAISDSVSTLGEKLPPFKTTLEEILATLATAVETGNFEKLQENIDAIVKSSESEGPAKLKEALEGVLEVAEKEAEVKKLVDAVAKLGEKEVAEGIQRSASAIKDIATQLTETAKQAKELAGDDGSLQDLIKRLQALGEEIKGKTLGILRDLEGGLGKVETKIDSISVKITEMTELIPALVEAAKNGIKEVSGALDSLLAKIEEVFQKLVQLREQAERTL